MEASESLIFCQNDLMSLSFNGFGDMRKKGELTDCNITSGNHCITGHRLVLAAAIPYFRWAFVDAADKMATIDVDTDVLESVICFAYTGKIEITQQNVNSLISASKFFKLTQVHGACWEFLEKRLDSSNVWEIRKLAKKYRYSKLIAIADNYIGKNFEEFSKSKAFLAVPFSYLRVLFSRDDVRVSGENIVFEAVVRWVKVSLSERSYALHELLISVRMSWLNPDYLEQVSRKKLIKMSPKCRELIDEAKKYHLLPKKMSDTSRIASFKTQPRIYEGMPRHAACVSDAEGNAICAVCVSHSGLFVKLLDMENKKWINLSNTESKIIHHVTAFGDIIYTFLESTVELFYLKTLKWRQLSVAHEQLFSSGIALHDKRIYFFGGPADISDSVRCFDTQENKWLKEHKMAKSLYFPAAASLGEFIYITGGTYGGDAYKAAERYDPLTKQWIEISPMVSERCGHGCASLRGGIYVCGGVNGAGCLNTAEIYDPQKNQWTLVAPMKVPRLSFSLVPYNGKLFALGMLTENLVDSADIEIYDPQQNDWEPVFPVSEDSMSTIFLINAEVYSGTYNTAKQKMETSEKSSCFCASVDDDSDEETLDHKTEEINKSPPGQVSRVSIPKRKRRIRSKAKNENAVNTPSKCLRCGRSGHIILNCPSILRDREKKCFACGVRGHLSRDCPKVELC